MPAYYAGCVKIELTRASAALRSERFSAESRSYVTSVAGGAERAGR